MRILVTGAGGLLGTELVGAAERRRWRITALGRADLDVTDASAVRNAIVGDRPDIVLHCAAYTAVDRAESEADVAHRVNVGGVRNAAEAAREAGALLVSFSTDFIFDGAKGAPYLPDDPPNPLGVYGRTKLEGERAVRASGADALVVRTSWLYGSAGRSFVSAILERAEAGEPLRVVDDQRGRPTWARNLAAVTLDLIERGARGTWHACDGGDCTWLELAREAIRLRGLDVPVEGVSTEAWGAPAPRPRYSVLDVSATEALLGRPMTPWRDALADFLEARA